MNHDYLGAEAIHIAHASNHILKFEIHLWIDNAIQNLFEVVLWMQCVAVWLACGHIAIFIECILNWSSLTIAWAMFWCKITHSQKLTSTHGHTHIGPDTIHRQIEAHRFQLCTSHATNILIYARTIDLNSDDIMQYVVMAHGSAYGFRWHFGVICNYLRHCTGSGLQTASHLFAGLLCAVGEQLPPFIQKRPAIYPYDVV